MFLSLKYMEDFWVDVFFIILKILFCIFCIMYIYKWKVKGSLLLFLVYLLVCNVKEGFNDICIFENIYLELIGFDGKFYYVNCIDSFFYLFCVEDRC